MCCAVPPHCLLFVIIILLHRSFYFIMTEKLFQHTRWLWCPHCDLFLFPFLLWPNQNFLLSFEFSLTTTPPTTRLECNYVTSVKRGNWDNLSKFCKISYPNSSPTITPICKMCAKCWGERTGIMHDILTNQSKNFLDIVWHSPWVSFR